MESKNAPRGSVSPESCRESPDENPLTEGGIDPENEIKGVKLLLLHTGLCLCTFLTGLVC